MSLHPLKAVLFALMLGLGAASVQAMDFSPQPVSATARCPVCGMYPASYPQWMAQVVFKDGAASNFDSPAELFRFLNAVGKYDKVHQAEDVAAIHVANYGGKGWLDARQAFFVFGSKALGPMNDANAPAFANRGEATAFVRKQGGKVLSFKQITPAVIKTLEDEDEPAHDDHHGHHH